MLTERTKFDRSGSRAVTTPMPTTSQGVALMLCVGVSALTGCAGIFEQIGKYSDNLRKQRAAMRNDFRVNDGYEDLVGRPGYSRGQDAMGKKVKFCCFPRDFQDTQFKPGATEKRDLAAFQSARIPADRYAVVDAWSFISVPIAEKDELLANMRENNEICFWSEGIVQPASRPYAQYHHIPASKWDGVLRANERHKGDPPETPPPSPPASSSANAGGAP